MLDISLIGPILYSFYSPDAAGYSIFAENVSQVTHTGIQEFTLTKPELESGTF